jgi:hypothetical protein
VQNTPIRCRRLQDGNSFVAQPGWQVADLRGLQLFAGEDAQLDVLLFRLGATTARPISA